MRRAIILAGGLGTRLRPYTTVLPKPLMPVGDRPVLDIVIRQLRHAGFQHITIATGYLAELIEAFFGDGSKYGVQIDYFREQEPLGTVGALALIDGLDRDDFLVMNGDVLTDLDYGALLDLHAASDATATIAAHTRKIQVSLGVMIFEGDDPTRLKDYVEKPSLDYQASMGVYCFSPEALKFIEPGTRLDFPDLVLKLVAAGHTVRAWPSTDFWLDIGRPEDYEEAQEHFERLRAQLIPEDEPAA